MKGHWFKGTSARSRIMGEIIKKKMLRTKSVRIRVTRRLEKLAQFFIGSQNIYIKLLETFQYLTVDHVLKLR
jgi:hypothetical protein